MEESYNYKKVEDKIAALWANDSFFTPKIDPSRKPFSMYLVPPNASGPMHVGNALMIAIQDILARHYRSLGLPTLWIPMTDHGGYETEITFERELEKIGKSRSDYSRQELFEKIAAFVGQNNRLIKDQIRKLGGSVDWTRFRFNMDDDCVNEIERIFKKMVGESLISRKPHMINYCPVCKTILSDIELKEKKESSPLYYIKFDVADEDGAYVTLATTKPEFLFSTTHVLAHPDDKHSAHLIGKRLINPVHGGIVEIIQSKRKFEPTEVNTPLTPFAQSYIKYDYEYALLSNIPIPARNLIDWDGNMTEHYTSMKPIDARHLEIDHLEKNNRIESIDQSHIESNFYCKKGHSIEPVIMMTWSLDLDRPDNSLKKKALKALESEPLTVFPQARKYELIKWLKIMKFWPIGRQNTWGIKIPAWYDISNPALFVIWFTNKNGEKRQGNLKNFLDEGVSLEEISAGLDRIYTEDSTTWTLTRDSNKSYLPETEVFDTWFSGQWATMIFGSMDSKDFSYFYPSDSIVIGSDLLRLSIARKIMLNYYLTNQLPYRSVYFHGLLKGADGQKMSKSLGNAVTLEHFLDKYGADVTRLSMISYTDTAEDFILSDDRLLYFKDIISRLWRMGRVALIAKQFGIEFSKISNFDSESSNLISITKDLESFSQRQIEKFSFALAQAPVTNFIANLEEFADFTQNNEKKEEHLSIFLHVFQKYLNILHPFAPFITEELLITLQ